MERPRKNITATIQPRKATDKGGWLCMPLADNIPNGKKGWRKIHCPICGDMRWKRPEEPEKENPYSKKRTQDPDELIPDLVEKAQMQQTLYDVLRMLDEWEYPSRHIDDAEENLRCATRELRDEIEKIQNIMTEGENKRE